MSPVECANAGVAGGSTGSNANCVTEQAMFPSEQKSWSGAAPKSGPPYTADLMRLLTIFAFGP